MALTKCKECGSEVSTTAKACPKCGAKVKKPAGIIGAILAVVFGGYVFSTFYHHESAKVEVVAPIKHEWRYIRSDKDKMSGEITEFAKLESDTTLTFEFPYQGGSKPSLTIMRTEGKKDYSVLLSVSKGQFLTCIRDCTLEAKFDDGNIKKYRSKSNHDGTTNMVFIEPENQFLEQLRHSKRLIISADFFKHPSQQMEFATTDFKW